MVDRDTGRSETLETLREIVSGDLDPLEGCRLVVRSYGLFGDRNDADYMTLVGIESETDDLPLGHVREGWGAEALQAAGRERDRYMAEVKAILLAACGSLLAKLERA